MEKYAEWIQWAETRYLPLIKSWLWIESSAQKIPWCWVLKRLKYLSNSLPTQDQNTSKNVNYIQLAYKIVSRKVANFRKTENLYQILKKQGPFLTSALPNWWHTS